MSSVGQGKFAVTIVPRNQLWLRLRDFARLCAIKQVRPSSGSAVYPHMPILRPHAARFHERRQLKRRYVTRTLTEL